MIRLFAYLVLLILLAAGAVWLADHPGAVTVEWLGWRATTGVPVLLIALAAILAGMVFVWRLLAFLYSVPTLITGNWRQNRLRRGTRALADGLAATAAGETDQARKMAKRADKLLGDKSLSAVLSAQAAQLSGDEKTAESSYTALLERPETAALGLRGLFKQALDRGDQARAIELGLRARQGSPGDRWLTETLFLLLLKTDRLREAEELIEDASRHKALPHDLAERRLAQILNERAARAAAANDRMTALNFAKRAVAADPELTDATVRLAELYGASGKMRRADRTLAQGWSHKPAPELLRAVAGLHAGESPAQRLYRLERLTSATPSHPEAAIALGEAALAARLWGQARKHLLTATETRPSRQLYRLLAKLEEAEYGDQAAAKLWLDKAESAPDAPQWVCGVCQTPSAEWHLLCPHCGALDSLSRSMPAQPIPSMQPIEAAMAG